MSFIFCVNIATSIIIVAYFVSGNQKWAIAFFQNKLLLIIIGIGSAYAHVLFGKHTGRYYSVDSAKSSRWKRYLFAYVCGSVALLVGAIFIAVLK